MPVPPFNPKRVKPASAVPKYRPDGNGRDLYQLNPADLERIPSTGVIFVENRREPKLKKFTSGSITGSSTALPNFTPNGTGRDLFQQCNPAPLVTHTGAMFSKYAPPASKKGLGVNRANRAPPKYLPNGTGRDLFFLDAPVNTRASIRREKEQKAPRPRTQPPPRFAPTGTGRDTFQNFGQLEEGSMLSTESIRSSSAPPKVKGFAYGDESLITNSKRSQEAVLRKFNDRMGMTIKPSLQKKSMSRLSTTSKKVFLEMIPKDKMSRTDSPLMFSPERTRAISPLNNTYQSSFRGSGFL
mmetsp:Transcript_24893/g.25112  ORF Transcript_24893/g.25112 Transcript_24893/m.25112 type:complete len:298 (+) Transcript_24893:188-1081(+)